MKISGEAYFKDLDLFCEKLPVKLQAGMKKRDLSDSYLLDTVCFTLRSRIIYNHNKTLKLDRKNFWEIAADYLEYFFYWINNKIN